MTKTLKETISEIEARTARAMKVTETKQDIIRRKQKLAEALHATNDIETLKQIADIFNKASIRNTLKDIK